MKGETVVVHVCVTFQTFPCRFNRKNLVLAGLWFSKEKPTMTTFLEPLIQDLNVLADKGVLLKPKLQKYIEKHFVDFRHSGKYSKRRDDLQGHASNVLR